MIGSIGTSVYQPIPRSLDTREGLAAPKIAATAATSLQLSPEAQQQVNKLRAIDQKVRQHEQAHISAAGGVGVSGATFQFQRGPDGKNYAIAGEVQIDTSPGNSPKETVEKARRIQAAALAPSDPSSADRAVAAAAAQMEAQASIELSRQRNTENTDQAKTATGSSQFQPSQGTAQNKRAIAAYETTAAESIISQLLAIA